MGNSVSRLMQSKDRLSKIVDHPWFMGLVAGAMAVASLKSPPLVFLSGPPIGFLALGGSLREQVIGLVLALLLLITGIVILGMLSVPAVASVFWIWFLFLVLARVFLWKKTLSGPLLVVGVLMSVQVLMVNLVRPEWQVFLPLGIGAGHDYRSAIAALKVMEGTEPRLLPGFTTILTGYALFAGFVFSLWAKERLGAPVEVVRAFAGIGFSRRIVFLVVFGIWLGGLLELGLLEDLLMVWISIYAVVGLSVLEGVIQVRRLPRLWMLPAWLLLLLAPPEILVTLALVGSVDAFVHFRTQGEGR